MRSGAAGVVLGCSRKRHSFADGVDLEDSCRDPLADVCPAPAAASARLSGPRPLSANMLQVCPLASLQTRFTARSSGSSFSTVWTPRHGMSGQTVSMARGPPEISSAAQTAMVAVVPPIMLTVTSGRRRAARPPAKPELPYKNGRQESQGDSHRHSPASVSDRSVLTLRLSRRLVLPVRTETCTEIRTNAAADAGVIPA